MRPSSLILRYTVAKADIQRLRSNNVVQQSTVSNMQKQGFSVSMKRSIEDDEDDEDQDRTRRVR